MDNDSYVNDDVKTNKLEINGSAVLEVDLLKASYNATLEENGSTSLQNGNIPHKEGEPPPPPYNTVAENKSNAHVVAENGKGTSTTVVKKRVGTLQAISIVIGTMIGAGIFASTAPVFKCAKSTGLSIVVWGASGILCMFCSLSYLELATMFPKSGGEFLYLGKTYGEIPAFLYVYATVLIMKPATLSAVTLVSAEYIIQPFLNKPYFPMEDQVLITKVLAAFIFGKFIHNHHFIFFIIWKKNGISLVCEGFMIF